MCSINIEGQHLLLSVKHHYLYTLPHTRTLCWICWTFAFFSSGPGTATVVSTGWGRSQRLFFCLHHCTLKQEREREVRAVRIIGSFRLLCCDSASVISSHVVQDTCSLTLSILRLENPKWKSGPVLVLQEMRLL